MKSVLSEGKLYSIEGIVRKVKDWRSKGQTIVFTNGVFDILHVGHLTSFEIAATFGDCLVVGVNSDSSARSLKKGPGRPFVSERERARLVAGFSVVDAVVIFEEPTPRKLIQVLSPDVLVKGSDWELDKIEGREFAGRVERVLLKEGFSTTALVKKIASVMKS